MQGFILGQWDTLWEKRNEYGVLVGKHERKKHWKPMCKWKDSINSLNSELNPICPLLPLFRAHHILHVSRQRVKMSLKRKRIGCELN